MSTPLHAAILNGGSPQEVECALREWGASSCVQVDPWSGELPLHTAARLGQAGNIRRLLRCGALVDARTTCGANATALHLAAAYGHAQAVDMLLSGGAVLSVVDMRGMTAAKLAQVYGHNDLAEKLDALRFEAGDYELGDIARVATNGWASVTDAASNTFADAASGLRSALGEWPSVLRSGDPSVSSRSAQAAGVPAQLDPAAGQPQREQQPSPTASPTTQLDQALEGVNRTIADVDEQAHVGHLRFAAGWQDDLTKASVRLDDLDVTDNAVARAERKRLIRRIDELSAMIDQRLAASAQALAACTAQVDEIEGRALQDDRDHLQWRNKLVQVAAALDAIECADNTQRAKRKHQLARIETLTTDTGLALALPESTASAAEAL